MEYIKAKGGICDGKRKVVTGIADEPSQARQRRLERRESS